LVSATHPSLRATGEIGAAAPRYLPASTYRLVGARVSGALNESIIEMSSATGIGRA
jgi:hypothetical protein